jgi:putative membrane protein
MMNGFQDGMGAGGWLLMSVFWVVLIAVVVWAIASLFPRVGGGRSADSLAERPEEILDRRLARGEIDAATYDTLRTTLRDARGPRA